MELNPIDDLQSYTYPEKLEIAIVQDDITPFVEFLAGKNSHHIDPLNGPIYRKSKSGKLSKNSLNLTRPLIRAVVLGSKTVIKFLLEKGADIHVTEPGNSNLFHCLVYAAYYYRHREEAMCEMYHLLCQLLPFNHLNKGLMAQNVGGYIPMELAAHLSTLELFNEILHTENVHIKTFFNGVEEEIWYDVTDYESLDATRHKASPLASIMLTPENRISHPNTKDFFRSAFYKTWKSSLKASLTPFLICSFLLRVFFFTGSFSVHFLANEEIVDIIEMNSSLAGETPILSNIPSVIYALSGLLCLQSLGTLIFHSATFIIHFKGQMNQLKTPKGIKNTCLRRLFYTITTVLLHVISPIIWLNSPFNLIKLDKFLIVLLNQTQGLALTWSLLYFLQSVPGFGYYIIALQRLLEDFILFIIIYIVFSLPFLELFYIYHSTHGVTERDFTFVKELYDAFRSSVEGTNIPWNPPGDLALLHFAFAFTMTILLLNFLIGLFSNSLAHIGENRNVIINIQRLSLLNNLNFRFGAIFPTLYIQMKKRYYTFHGGKIYVVVYRHLR